MQWKKFVLIGLVVCSTAALGAATETKAGARYVDPIQGFSMAAPAFIPPLTERTVVASFPVGIDGDFTSNINIMVDPVKTTRKEYVAAAIEALKVSNPKAVYNANKEMEVSGKEAQLIDFEANVGSAKRRLRFMQLTVFAEDRVYIITCTAPLDSFAVHEAEFRKCIESFRLE